MFDFFYFFKHFKAINRNPLKEKFDEIKIMFKCKINKFPFGCLHNHFPSQFR